MSIDEPDAEGVIVHKYNFPPFPEPLPGRELPPFEKFVSKGIIKPSKPTNPDAPPPVELDGLGIPTVRLHAEHAIGGDVTKKKKKKKKKKTLDVRDENGRQLQWWELWAEDEDERGPGAPYSKSMDETECLVQSTADFFSSRQWPGNTSMIHPVWTHIKLFVGAETLAGAKDANGRPPHLSSGGAISDDGMDDDDVELGVETGGTLRERPTSRMSMGGPTPESGLEEVDEFEPSPEEIRSAAFISDTESHVRMFFSSYFIDRGLVWNEYKCREGPKLFAFFIKFILRNRLLRDDATNARLEASLAICDKAGVELPAAFTIGAAMSGVQISEALSGLWGKKLTFDRAYNDGELLPVEEEKEDEVQWTAARDVIPIDSEDFLADASAREAFADNIDNGRIVPESKSVRKENRIEEVPDEDRLAPPSDEASAPEADAPPPEEPSRWGKEPPENSSGWAWAAAHLDRPPEWKIPDDAKRWGTNVDADTVPEDAWTVYKAITIGELLGPTNLPVTHHSGVVEHSTRRVKEILAPVTHLAPTEKGEAAAVEHKLRVQFSRVVFSPWAASSDALALRSEGKSDIIAPSTLPASVGRVVPDARGHDFDRDDIEVLMDADKAAKIVVGMGFTGIWVQVAREGDEGGEKDRLWYMESVSQFLPSFYVPLLY